MGYRFRRSRGHFTAPVSRTGNQFIYDGRRVTIKGDHFNLTWNGPEVIKDVLENVNSALQELSDEALTYMTNIVPVDTGALRDSCYVIVNAETGRLQLVIGAGMPYAIYVELGSSRNAAQPFMRPTFDYVISKLPELLRGESDRRNA